MIYYRHGPCARLMARSRCCCDADRLMLCAPPIAASFDGPLPSPLYLRCLCSLIYDVNSTASRYGFATFNAEPPDEFTSRFKSPRLTARHRCRLNHFANERASGFADFDERRAMRPILMLERSPTKRAACAHASRLPATVAEYFFAPARPLRPYRTI